MSQVSTSSAQMEAREFAKSKLSDSQYGSVSKLFMESAITREFAAQLMNNIARRSLQSSEVVEIFDVPIAIRDKHTRMPVYPTWPHILEELCARAWEKGYKNAVKDSMRMVVYNEDFAPYRIASTIRNLLKDRGIDLGIDDPSPPSSGAVQVVFSPGVMGPLGGPIAGPVGSPSPGPHSQPAGGGTPQPATSSGKKRP